MNLVLTKRLINDKVLDFPKLLMLYYKDILLTEVEAFVLLELFQQIQNGNTYLNPKMLLKNMTMELDTLLDILDGLMKKGYLNIKIMTNDLGKETEVFDIDETIKKCLSAAEKQAKIELLTVSEETDNPIEEIAMIIEKQFQKQLSPLDAELITKWLNEDQYSKDEIKQAMFDALKSNRFSMSYVDNVLMKKRNVKKTRTSKGKVEKSEALKSFLKSMDE